MRLEVFDFICSLSRNFIDFMSSSVIHGFFSCLDLFNLIFFMVVCLVIAPVSLFSNV